MSGARKLQTEIDRVMKKVDEGVELFDEIWEKVYSADTQNQKEKYEMDLKKEIKKLQRLRDQIKTWISSNDVKDKDHLLDARKLIESKMEQFKICEKETKTKAYSKEGLAKAERLDPAEQAKQDTMKWIGDFIDKLQELVDEREVEIERLSAGKGKKSNKHQIEEYNHFVTSHKFHISKLEGIMRLVNNDRLEVETVDPLKEDLEYYIESYEDDDYQQAYDEEYFYEALGLEELDVVNVDRVTYVNTGKKEIKAAEEVPEKTSKGKKEKKTKSSSSIISLKIGRATSTASKGKDEEEKKTPSKARGSSNKGDTPAPSLGPAPSARPPPVPPVSNGQSMAALLKSQRESEQAAKEKQRQQEAQAAQLREQQRQAEIQRQQQIQRQQEAALRQQEALRQQQQQQQAQEQALKQRQQQELARQEQQKEAAAKQQQLQAQQQAQQQAAAAQQEALKQRSQNGASTPASTGGALDILTSGLGGLSLGNVDLRSDGTGSTMATTTTTVSQTAPSTMDNALGASLNESLLHMPTGVDSDRPRTYTPRNPYPTPTSYPSSPSSMFDNPAVFEKLGTDCLFFIFYYAQGTYQQYLAARELKKQSWRYHKKYMTWFQRHEEPKVKTDEYEEGTYVYFDYESGWCQRIKADFRFEYTFLEDSLQ